MVILFSLLLLNTANPNADMISVEKTNSRCIHKIESDGLLLQKLTWLMYTKKTETYTKSEVDSAITPKADKTYVDDAVGN